jgi:hypothetical protein
LFGTGAAKLPPASIAPSAKIIVSVWLSLMPGFIWIPILQRLGWGGRDEAKCYPREFLF